MPALVNKWTLNGAGSGSSVGLFGVRAFTTASSGPLVAGGLALALAPLGASLVHRRRPRDVHDATPRRHRRCMLQKNQAEKERELGDSDELRCEAASDKVHHRNHERERTRRRSVSDCKTPRRLSCACARARVMGS
jgi:hypothetical protein